MSKLFSILISIFLLMSFFTLNTNNCQAQEVQVTGQLQRTVEEGGWLVTNTNTGINYLLLGIEQCKSLPWFTEGTKVNVTGTIQEDVATIFMQGTPLKVREISPMTYK